MLQLGFYERADDSIYDSIKEIVRTKVLYALDTVHAEVEC